MPLDAIEYFSQHSADATPAELALVENTYRANAEDLLPRVDALLDDLEVPEVQRVQRSGWRPAATNADTANAAPHSKHLTGNAIDIADDDGAIDDAITDDLLAEHGLYREHPSATYTWVHLQNLPPESGRRTYFP